MAKKSVVSYAGLALGASPEPVRGVSASEPQQAVAAVLPGTSGTPTLKDTSAHLMLYLHPAAAKALKRYALDQDVKVHDLLIEAVESWFRAHGLQEPVRAKARRRRGWTNASIQDTLS